MKYLIFLLISISIIGCINVEQSPRPDPFYGDDKMVNILTDLYLLESAVTTNRRSFLKLNITPDQYIYKKYKIDSVSFSQHFKYYTDRIEQYQDILVRVEDNLKSLKDSVAVSSKNKKVPELKVADSIHSKLPVKLEEAAKKLGKIKENRSL